MTETADVGCNKAPATAQSTNLNTRMRRMRFDVLYGQLGQGLGATVINAGLLAYIQSSVVNQWQTFSWLAVMLIVCIARAVLLVARNRSGDQDRNSPVWEYLFFAGVVATACVWGSAALVLFPPGDLIHQAFIGFVLAGMTAGAMGSFAASHRVFLAFMLPSSVPYATMLLLQDSGTQTAMGVMTLAFIATTWVTSKKTNATTTEALRLRFENLDLVEQLEKTNDELMAEVAERERASEKMATLVQQAEAATDAKSHFLANMSHEIRTPMNGVIGMADILSRSQLDNRQRHQLSLIQNSAQILLALLNDILDFSRIEAGRVELEKESFDIREVVGDAVDVLADQAESKGLELAYEVAPEISARVIGDQMRLRQILINLIGNAVKFTESGSVVLRVSSLGSSADGRAVIRFGVRDTGIGIDPAVRRSLFDPFKQADASVARRFGGTGLGLSISYHLVELMQGEMACTSVLGEGSEFFFSIPLEADRRRGSQDLKRPIRFSRCRILVVDENVVTLDVIGNYLKSWGVDAVLEETGAGALSALKDSAQSDTPFAAVIASATSSDMSGLELASHIREHQAVKSTKVILLTPVQWSGDMQLAETRNIVSTINKPVRQSQLFNALNAVVTSSVDVSRNDSADDLSDEPNENEIEASFNAHVLLVEDNPVNQEVAAHYLRSFGCTLDIADSGVTALTQCDSTSYDLIFMDCQMPTMDGYTATRHVRAREQARSEPRTPIVALTASAFAGDREQCLAAGMDDYISKPFAPNDLHAVLEKWLAGGKDHTNTKLALGEPTGGSDDVELCEPLHDALDRQQLAAMRARSPGLLQKLIALYQQHAPSLLAKLSGSQSAGDCAAIKSAAHALKSSSSNIAATRLAELCQLLEVNAQQNDISAARSNFDALSAEFERVQAALRSEAAADAELIE